MQTGTQQQKGIQGNDLAFALWVLAAADCCIPLAFAVSEKVLSASFRSVPTLQVRAVEKTIFLPSTSRSS